MINEPRVGMRVCWISTRMRCGRMRTSNIYVGDTGTITRLDSDGYHKVVMDKDSDYHYAEMEALTEIKESDTMYLHKAVKQAGETGEIKHETWSSWYTVTGTMELYSRVGTNGSGIRELTSSGWQVKPKPKEKQYCEYCGKKL